MSSQMSSQMSVERSPFNAEMIVTSNMTKMVSQVAIDLAQQVVEELSYLYGFDSEEALSRLNLCGLSVVSSRPSVSRSSAKSAKSAKSERPVKEKAAKERPVKSVAEKESVTRKPSPSFPLPFSGEFDDACCYGLRQNQSLYTQCLVLRKGDAEYCKSCQSQADKNASGEPDYGTIQQRLAVAPLDFVTAQGKKPLHYTKTMKKLELTREQVEEEAAKFGITVAECHFSEPTASASASESKKGRPKKEKMIVEVEGATNDLFASLVAEASSESESDDGSVVVKVSSKGAKKQKEEEKAAKEAEKAAALKKKEEEKAAKEAEKAAALKKKEAEKASALKKKEAASSKKKPVVAEEEEVPEDVCEKINEAGQTKKEYLAANPEGKFETKYLRSKNYGTVYEKDGDAEVGTWNAQEGKIVFNQEFVESENEEEAEEEEYDE